MPQEKSIHTGHRERLKERFEAEGLENFNEINVLELLLFYCIPQGDTNPLAHRLIDEFGSLKNVLEADPAQLRKVKGIGTHASLFLSLIRQASRYYSVKCAEISKNMNSIDAYGDYIKKRFLGESKEMVYILCLDAKGSEIKCHKVTEGSINSANVSVRRIVELALRDKATMVILAHNHPSGLAIPSREDIDTTKQIQEALGMVEIYLADHLVVAGDDYTSMSESGYLQ